MKKDITLILLTTLMLIIVLQLYTKFYIPFMPDGPERLVVIPEGMSVKEIGIHLESEGIIYSAMFFGILSRIYNIKNLKAGEYSLAPSMSPLEILYVMEAGRVVLNRITIPEGLNIFQVAEILDQKGIIDKSKFLKLATDTNYISFWDIPGESAEGYLFPETYLFGKGISEKRILDSMLNQFFRKFDDGMAERARELGFSVHEVVTLASLIEKETGLPEERSLISAVFHNRLKGRIPLQCDPTVIYGLKTFNGNLTRDDLLRKTPYNTYRIIGLPPGPIANPGLASLKAALYPAEVEYKYFVSRNDGSHVFSETLTEHNRAVYKYQKKRKQRL